jgi:hypothetical protein
MILKEWIKSKRLTPEKFGVLVGASTGAVLKWISGERFPRKPHLTKIKEVTKGKVQANDFA